MPVAEFEEKAFEGPLNSQLLNGNSNLFTPGQVLEAAIGFDAAMYTHHAGFWALWNGRHPTPPPGVILTPRWWPRSANNLSRLPSFRLNLFLQYKRPYHLTRSNAAEWQYWGRSYFRYYVIPRQQAALTACAQNLDSNGLVVYASPAFATYQELFLHIQNRSLVNATNFVETPRLNNHSRYTYVDSGNQGSAFSEPEKIESLAMKDELPSRVEKAPEIPRDGNALFLADTAISAALENATEFLWWREWFEDRVRSAVVRITREVGHEKFVAAYLRVTFFTSLMGWKWLVGA